MPLAAPRSAVAARLTKPVAVAWAKKVPTPMRIMPSKTAARFGSRSSGKPTPASASEPHGAERQRWTHQYEVDVSERADEREQDAKSDAERRAQPRIGKVLEPGREGRGWDHSGLLHRS